MIEAVYFLRSLIALLGYTSFHDIQDTCFDIKCQNRYPDLSMNAKENDMINEAFEPKPEVSSLHADHMENPGRLRIRRAIPIYDSSESEPESTRKNSKCPSKNIQDLYSDISEVNSEDNDRISLDIKSEEQKPSSWKEMKKKQWTPQKMKVLIEKRRLLELQMKQTMDMY
ncbi:hypothetical protein LIER_43758 [Lithospermum erythrorhizon]|uniref:Uncharacterized protein n=1 Tax=Lithospermum erythrorhizon TaxID=34254 RepID=A0AAV3QRU7_LITER